MQRPKNTVTPANAETCGEQGTCSLRVRGSIILREKHYFDRLSLGSSLVHVLDQIEHIQD